MKKTLLIIALWGISFFLHAQTWINLGSSTPTEITATVTESNNQNIRIHFGIQGFHSESIFNGNDTYQRLSIPGAGRTLMVGFPELPLLRQMVAIPECSNVSLSFQVTQEQVLNNFNVYPAPDYQGVINPDSTFYVEEVFSVNAMCYTNNSVYPSNNVELTETGYFRSQKYAELQVSPIRYNPTTQKLCVATEIEVTLTLTNATGNVSANLGIFNNVAAHTMLNYQSTGMTAEVNDMRFGRGSVNYIELQTPNQASSIQADYLIICANQFIENDGPSEEIMRIANHRANYNGFDVAILNIDNVLQVGFPCSDTSYKNERVLKSCIEKVYEGNNANHTFDGHLGYVLFVGKPPTRISELYENPNYHGFLPTSYTHGVEQIFLNEPRLKYPSDYWYSCVTHDNQNVYDSIGDLYIGRFCAYNNTELCNIVEKTIKREREYRPLQSRIINAANDKIYDFMEDYFSDRYYPYLRGLLGYDKTLTTADRWEDSVEIYRSKVLNMLNEGSPLFIINTHGGIHKWETLIEDFSYDITDSLNNGNTMNQFCLSYACLTGAMDRSRCLGQAITTDSPLNGMVGFLCSGRLMPVRDYDPETVVIGLLPKAIYNDMSHIAGEFVLESLMKDSDRQMRFKLNLFGDPALNIMAKGYEVTNEITLDEFTEINDVITIKDGGMVIIPDRARVVFGDNAGFNVMPTGALSIGENVFIKSINGNNSFIKVKGGELLISANEGVSFEKIDLQFSNPLYVSNKTYNLNNMHFFMTELNAEVVNINIDSCSFEESSHVLGDHTCFDIENSSFSRSGLVISYASALEIPQGGASPTSNALISNCVFIDCTSFEYFIHESVRAISNSAIRLQNVSNYEVKGVSITRCVEGIYIKNSGNAQNCQLNKNNITGCSGQGVIVYNSFANFNKNSISANSGTGISIFNNSLVTLDDSPGNPNDYQYVGMNNPYQIYASNNSFPKCNYNKFVGNNAGDYWLFYDASGASSLSPLSQFNVKYNNWNGNLGFNPNDIFNVPNRFEWLPFWTIAKSGEGQTDGELLYELAVQDFEDSLYTKAKLEFMRVVSEYPDDWVSIPALKELLRVENCLEKDYWNLKNYYLTNETIRQDSVLNKLAGFLSARCDVNMGNYEDALVWYAAQLEKEGLDYQDSVFYVIDIGDLYFMMGEDSIYSKSGISVWLEEHVEMTPKSLFNHENRTKQLLSSLPFNDGKDFHRTVYGEFYSYTGWEDPNHGSGIRCLAHYTEHGKKVELPYSYLIDEPGNMGIGNYFITDATPGVLYNKDEGVGQTNKLYRSMDYGYSWEVIDDLSGLSDEYWTFKNAPGVLFKRNTNPEERKISYDYGGHFEHINVPSFYYYNVAGWNVGEFFRLGYDYDLSSYYLTHSMDYNQTVDTVFYSELGFEMAVGADEGELYTYYKSYDSVSPYTDKVSYTLYFSPDYGRHNQKLMIIDSLIEDDVYVSEYWEFIADNEPGVFYSIKRETSIIYANNGKIWIDYYRDYGDSLVTTYFHHFRPNWYSQHSPVMDCEVAGCDENNITLRWNEPEQRPEEVLVGYQVFRGETMVSDGLVSEMEYMDHYSGGGQLKYHVLAVYNDGTTSMSYNIAYCNRTESVHDSEVVSDITVSPNPTNGIFRIDGVKVAKMQVYNALGQLVKTVQSTNEIDLSALPEGVYLLRMTSTDGHVHFGKVALGK